MGWLRAHAATDNPGNDLPSVEHSETEDGTSVAIGCDNKEQVSYMFDNLIQLSRTASEQDFRLAILNAVICTPHRQIAPFIPLFNLVNERDPRFFGQLAVWYYRNGGVHDLKQLFIAYLATSKFSDEYREAGIALMQELPPYQVERVLGIVKGHTEGKAFVPGIAQSVPRCVRTGVEEYLRKRERDTEAFDNAVLHARKQLKSLYASLRIKPGDYAQKVLFDNDPPEGSRLRVLKELAAAKDPTAQARLIVENRIPYRVAISAIKQLTPSMIAALVSAMTPQEVINNLASLKKRGVMDNADLRKLVEAKLESGKTDKRVSALKTREAVKAAGLDADMAAKVTSVGDQQIKSKARIQRPTALHIDKSGSMTVAIDVGKQIAAIVAPICEKELYVHAFDTMAYEITAKGAELSHWEAAFKGINAGGGTACGAGVEMMRRKQQFVEQIIMVTDQGENQNPRLVPSLQAYSNDMHFTPHIIIVNVGAGKDNTLERALDQAGMSCDTFTFSGDYYSLPSLLPMIAGGDRTQLLLEIMSVPLPERKSKTLAAAAR